MVKILCRKGGRENEGNKKDNNFVVYNVWRFGYI